MIDSYRKGRLEQGHDADAVILLKGAMLS